ncbi:MAG: hypothetical protein QOI73_1165 [Solirubrobacteraceae bacterium]|nr:hypothetical protein [Solirubrobacteraceae bacterium]
MTPQPPKPGSDDDPAATRAQPKQIEKVKADKEHPEKFKADKEHPEKFKADKEHPEKIKPEKEGKLEAKEIEKVKRDDEKLPFEKLEIEKSPKENVETVDPGQQVFDPASGLNAADLLRHADSLEQAGRQLRHFIEASQRPDLSEGALRNEEDLTSGDDDG